MIFIYIDKTTSVTTTITTPVLNTATRITTVTTTKLNTFAASNSEITGVTTATITPPLNRATNTTTVTTTILNTLAASNSPSKVFAVYVGIQTEIKTHLLFFEGLLKSSANMQAVVATSPLPNGVWSGIDTLANHNKVEHDKI